MKPFHFRCHTFASEQTVLKAQWLFEQLYNPSPQKQLNYNDHFIS